MLVSRYFIEFILFSFVGWIYESLYCTIKGGHWSNRGFLFGPICPIYGFGAMSIRLISSLTTLMPGKDIPLWQIFLGFAAGSAVLEYVTSWAMEKMFHSRWWDYNDMPLNLNGRICLPASLLFGLVGTLDWIYIIPILPKMHNVSNSLLVESVSLVLMGAFAMDLAISIQSTRNLIEKMERGEEMFNDAAEKGVLKIRSIPGRVYAAGSKVKGVTKSIGPKVVRMIENPSEQMHEYALRLSKSERDMLSRIKTYFLIHNRNRDIREEEPDEKHEQEEN